MHVHNHKKKRRLCPNEILHEGIATGDFRIGNVKECALVIVNAVHGLDVPYIRDSLSQYGFGDEKIRKVIADLILNGRDYDKMMSLSNNIILDFFFLRAMPLT